MEGKTNHLLSENSSISVDANNSLVPEQVYPNAAHGAHRVEERPDVLHFSQLSSTRRVGVPVRDAVPDVCIENMKYVASSLLSITSST